MRDTESLMQEVYACSKYHFITSYESVLKSSIGQAVQAARERFARTQKDTQEAFATYSRYLEAERQARQDVATAEQLRDDISTSLSKSPPSALAHLLRTVQHLLARNQAQGRALVDSF